VSTAITDSISVIHGPDGCTHHNYSLLHALGYEHDISLHPTILSSSLTETQIVFGGEESLKETLRTACERDPGVICVLTSCVAAAIGDDVQSVCDEAGDVPVVMIPTGGFLGGGFSRGVGEALLALSSLGKQGRTTGGVTLVGEKNLEFEAEANFQEMSRLLALLGVPVQLRFVRNITAESIACLGCGSLNILRDPSLTEIGEALKIRFGTAFLPSFPTGFGGTLDFLARTGHILGIDSTMAVISEEKRQEKVISTFADICGSSIALDRSSPASRPVLDELREVFDLAFTDSGVPVRFPDPPPVGTSGLSRMLHRWRRACRA
jgi:nitrogenase molybdenum-iron protein alpha/beta subunit